MQRLLFVAMLAIPRALTAQTSPPVSVAIHVVDSARAPIAGADIAIVRGVTNTVAHSVTDANGRATLAVSRASDSHQLIVRKIGFQRGYRFFQLTRDTIALDMVLVRSVATLEAVQVSAEMDLKRKSYHLDADEIENSSRPFIDASDIFKIRPDMMSSRGGATACAVPYTPRTGWIESVWVNGQRVTMAPVDSGFAKSRAVGLGIGSPPPRPNPRIVQSRAPKAAPPPWTVYSHMDTVLSILHLIKPEHIAEVTYKDCFDQSVGKVNSDLAMFIALKPGIGFKNGWGTYVIEDTAATAPRIAVSDLPGYRFRVLGVFDGESGNPMDAVEVADSVSGLRAKTTTTGTVSLFFVPEGPATLRLHRDGFRDTTLTITIGPSDTIPVTAVMSRPHP